MTVYRPRPQPLYDPHMISREDFTYLQRGSEVKPISNRMLAYYREKGEKEDHIWNHCTLVPFRGYYGRCTLQEAHERVDREIRKIKDDWAEQQLVWCAVYDYDTGKWHGYHHESDYNLGYAPLAEGLQTLPKHKEWKDGVRVIVQIPLVEPLYRPGEKIRFSYGPGPGYKGQTFTGAVKFYFQDGYAPQYYTTRTGHQAIVRARDVLGLA